MKKAIKSITCLLLAVLIGSVIFTGIKANAKNKFGFKYEYYFTRVGQALKVKATGAVQKNIKWTSRDPKIAKITKTGKIKGVKVGETTIAAEYKGERVTFKIYVVPKKTPNASELIKKIVDYTDKNRTNAGEVDILGEPALAEYEYRSVIFIGSTIHKDNFYIRFGTGDSGIPVLRYSYCGDNIIYDLTKVTKDTTLEIYGDTEKDKKATKQFHEILETLDEFLFEKFPEYTLADLGLINYK